MEDTECQGCREDCTKNYMIVSNATTDGSHLDLCMECGPETLSSTPESKIVDIIGGDND
jgi:hypothetical protein